MSWASKNAKRRDAKHYAKDWSGRRWETERSQNGHGRITHHSLALRATRNRGRR